MIDNLNHSIPIDLTKKIVTNEKAVEDFMHEGDVMTEDKSIKLTMSKSIEKKLLNVREHLHAPDNETAARIAIALYSKLIDDKKSGREVRIHNKDGKQYRLDFTSCA